MKLKRTANYSQVRSDCIPPELGRTRRSLDVYLACPQNDTVIASAGSHAEPSATRTILVIDDDPSVTDTYARILTLEGFQVATAVSAEAGLELAENIRPDGIILDMRMPITSGLQFLRLVRARPHLIELPVAIVTGDYFLPEPLDRELKALGAAVCYKPLRIEDLVTLARTLVSA